MELKPVRPVQAFEQPLPTVINTEETESGSFRSRLGDKLANFKSHLGNVLGAVGTDYQESENRVALVAAGLGTVAVQAVDRARLSIVLVPHVAISTLEHTNSSWQAGAAAGLTFAGWCAGVGGTTAEGLRQYPNTMESVKENFPGAVKFFQDALPGVDSYDKDKEDTRSLPRKIGGRILTGLSRGWTVTGIGTVAYVSTAAAKGEDRSTMHKLNANASADGGVIVGGVAGSVSYGITKISDPELAQNIIDVAGDSRVWYGVAGAMIAGQYASNKWKQYRARRNPQPEIEHSLSTDQTLEQNQVHTEQ